MDNERVANWVISHQIQLESCEKEITPSKSPIQYEQEGYSSNVNRQTDLEVLNEPGPSNVSERTFSNSPVPVSAPCTNESCRNLRANIQNLSYQIASYHRDNVLFEQSETEKSQLKGQLAELTTYVETLTNQLYDSRNQLRKTEMEADAARKKELEIKRHMEILETHSANLRKKAEERDTFEKRYLGSVRVLEDLQAKRLQISQNLQQLVPVYKKTKTENENLKLQCEKIRADKAAAMTKVASYKKQIPAMLRLIDDLATHSDALPAQIRKRVDSFADQTTRAQLIGGQTAEPQNDDIYADLAMSDDELVDDIEALINNGVKASTPVKKLPTRSRTKSTTEDEADQPNTSSGMKFSPPREPKLPARTIKTPVIRQTATRSSGRIALRFGRKGGQHNVADAERAYNDMLSSKLHKNEVESTVEPLVSGAKSSIHGKKGITIREQQAKMISVSEKVAQMKKEKETSPKRRIVPPPPLSIPSQSSTSQASFTNTDTAPHRHMRFSTPDLNNDLRLTPSPVKLTPTGSIESLIEKELQKTPEKNTVPTAPSMPSLVLEEPILEDTSIPTTSSFASMPHLDALNEESMDEKPLIEVETPKKASKPKQKTPKKVTFELSDDEIVVEKPTQERPRTLSESSMESNPLEFLESIASTSKAEEAKAEESPSPSSLSEGFSEDLPSTSKSSEKSPKITTPTKKALKNMSGVSEEIRSPIKNILMWTASRMLKSQLSEESEDEDSKQKELQINLGENTKESSTQSKSAETSQQSKDSETKEKLTRVARKKVTAQLQKEDNSFSLDILQSAHLRTQDESKSAKTPVAIKKAVETAPIELAKKEIKEAPKKYTISPKKTESKPKAPIRTFQNPSAQMEQAKLAISKKLKAMSNSQARKPAQKGTNVPKTTPNKRKEVNSPKKQLEKKKERIVEEAEPAEPIEEEESVEEKSKRATRATRAQKQVPQTAPLIIEPPAKTRQAKRKATEETPVSAKKIAPSAEINLKKAFDLECSIQDLKRKIPADELEQIKEIPVKKYLSIMIEHVLQMKSVDMWQIVFINYKKGSTETVHNKMEENFISMAHELCSDDFSVVLPFARNLLMKLLSLPKIEAGLCHKMVRLISISIEALQKLGEDDENGKKIIKGLIKYLSMKRPDLLGKSLVYILNRLSQNYLDFLTEDEYQEAWKILVLHSGEEITSIIDFYWREKGGAEAILPTKISVESWLSQLSISKEMITDLEVNGTNLKRNATLNKLFDLRSLCFCTPKNFEKYLLPETNALKRKLLDLVDLYKIHDAGDAVIGSIFGSSSRSLNDPGMETVLEVAVQIQGLTSLFEKILDSTGVFKTEEFFSSIAEGTEHAYELVEFLQSRQENASSTRLILSHTLEEFLEKYSSISDLL